MAATTATMRWQPPSIHRIEVGISLSAALPHHQGWRFSSRVTIQIDRFLYPCDPLVQGFDIGDVNFADPLEALHYEEHITFPFPTHANTNCAACHAAGTNNVPDQAKSLPVSSRGPMS